MMWNQIPVIIRSFRKHKGTVVLLMSMVALTVAVFANAASVIGEAVRKSQISTGIDEANVAVIQDIAVVNKGGSKSTQDKLARIRALPGVVDVALGATPLMNSSTMYVSRAMGESAAVEVKYFEGSQGYQNALGVKVSNGDNLRDASSPNFGIDTAMTPCVITAALADRLFGQEASIGKTIYAGNLSFQVVGIVPTLRESLSLSEVDNYAMLVQHKLGQEELGGLFVIRSSDGQVQKVLNKALSIFRDLDPYHVQPLAETFEDLKVEALARRLALAKVLSLLLIVLTCVTCFTIGSITSLWVRQRRTQIGVRRALGATRMDVLAYFLFENGMVTSVGAFFGVLLAFLTSSQMQKYFELSGITWHYVVCSILLIVTCSGASALGPAWRGSRLAPAVVFRNI